MSDKERVAELCLTPKLLLSAPSLAGKHQGSSREGTRLKVPDRKQRCLGKDSSEAGEGQGLRHKWGSGKVME